MVPNMCPSPAEPGFPRDVWRFFFVHLWCSNTPLHLQWPKRFHQKVKAAHHTSKSGAWFEVPNPRDQQSHQSTSRDAIDAINQSFLKPDLGSSKSSFSICLHWGTWSCCAHPWLPPMVSFAWWALQRHFHSSRREPQKKGKCHGRSPMLAAFLQWIKMGWPPSKNSLARTS